MGIKKNITRATNIARSHIVIYQKNGRWYVAAFKTERQADDKAMRLIDMGRTLVLLCRAYAEIRPLEEDTARSEANAPEK